MFFLWYIFKACLGRKSSIYDMFYSHSLILSLHLVSVDSECLIEINLKVYLYSFGFLTHDFKLRKNYKYSI